MMPADDDDIATSWEAPPPRVEDWEGVEGHIAHAAHYLEDAGMPLGSGDHLCRFEYAANRLGVSAHCAVRIAHLAGARAWVSRDADGCALMFMGHKPSIVIARRLSFLCDQSYAAMWQATPRGTMTRHAFKDYYAKRFNRALVSVTNGADPVRVAKIAEVDAVLARRGIQMPAYA